MLLFIFFLISEITALNLCLQSNTDLCLGLSGLEPGRVLAGAPLQLKSRYKSLLYDSELRIQFLEDVNKSLYFKFENQTLWVDKANKGSLLGILSKKSDGAVFSQNQISIYNSTRCLTVMRCPSGICSSEEDKRELTTPKKGAYLNFLPCDGVGFQLWEADPPCHKGCTDEMLLNNVCDQECNYIECFNDFSSCNATLFPTSSPTTRKPTKKTKIPTKNPSQNPSKTPTSLPGLTFSPTLLPIDNIGSLTPSTSPTTHPGVVLTPTFQPSLGPTYSPTLLPSSSPTQSPTHLPSALPSLLPSLSPSLNPTLKPQESNLPVTLPPVTSPPSPANLPQGATLAPTAVATPYFDPGWIALIVVAFLILFCVGGFIFWKKYFKENKPKLPPPQLPGRLPVPEEILREEPDRTTQAFV